MDRQGVRVGADKIVQAIASKAGFVDQVVGVQGI